MLQTLWETDLLIHPFLCKYPISLAAESNYWTTFPSLCILDSPNYLNSVWHIQIEDTNHEKLNSGIGLFCVPSYILCNYEECACDMEFR